MKVNVSATLQLAKGGKHWIASSMTLKGLHFLMASQMLKEKTGNSFVVLHLMGQGLECTLKGILLHHDYDYYMKKSKGDKTYLQKSIGHDLYVAMMELCKCKNFANIRLEKTKQLKEFSEYYKTHRLRYGNAVDIYVDAKTICVTQIERIVMVLVKYIIRNNLAKVPA